MLKSISLRLCTLIVLLFAGICSFAQQVQVKGTVVEKSSGESIIGASVMEVGSNSNGTITDIDGNFTLSVASGATLSISYIGYKTVTVKAQSTLRIELTEDSQLIDEVVVTGYMSEKKASLTGSVAVVKMKDVADIPTGNVLSSLQGRVAGMNITTDGTPGGGNTSTLVRGKSSFRGDANSPLYVIDGVMTRENISSILSSNDVESIQVLKDAASASIYGAQAANGVIIITTKRAKKGETRVDFDMSLTLQGYQCGFDMLNADEWGQVYWSAYKYANNGATPSSEIYGNGATPKLQDYIGLNGAKVHAVDTDWRDVVYRTALMQNYSATLSKGSDNGAFSLALNYLDHDGLVENTNFQRINTRISSNYHYLDNRLRIGENVAVNRWTQTLSPAGVDENAIKQHPAKTVYDENGDYNDAINDVLGDAPNMARLLENEKR
ncbi:SusC/RagA family TonB-linked outer membrane protein, partial [uncultured Bacteroides sp.]